jgi:YidC/Oxa1 family membrane protein insertase
LPQIQNPNLQSQGSRGSGGGDMRTTMIFTFVALLGVFAYQYFFPSKQSGTTTSQTQSQTQTQQTQTQTAAPAAPPTSAQAAPKTLAQTPAVTANLESQIEVENEVFKVVLSNRGALIRNWILKQYNDSSGKPLDMVQPQAAARFGFPLSLYTYEPGLSSQVNGALYQVLVNGTPPSPAGRVTAPATITFHYAANGLDVVKSIHFDSSYVVSIDSQVTRNGAPVRALVEWPAGLGDMEEFAPNSITNSQVLTSANSFFSWSLNGKQDTLAAKKVSGNATLDGPYQYAAITDLYFAAALLPDAPERTTVVTLHNTIDLATKSSDPNSKKTPASVIGIAVGDTSGVTRLRLFAGPKALDVLKSIHAVGADGRATGQNLEPLIQFGWLTVIAKPLYLALRYLRDLMGPGAYNWGWAIIVVTVIFNLLMLPTRFMMMRSSLKMMRIQPKVDAIKRRFANLKMNDPKRAEMNTEMMALYKTEGVNMYGSCLPLLVQMPLFFAYYKVLANVIELRQAQWFWLTDLSAPDPRYILPILIIATMFLVQYITPSPGMDPAQRRMMAFMMPAIFGFTMLHFASGLALYWGTGNVINLALQVGINRSSMGKEMHAISARRAAKKLTSARK